VNFFKLYIGDYQRDTAHLSVTEHGAYMLMLQHYYATERPLPIGKALHRMLRAQDKPERDAIDAVASQFWTTTPDGLVNGRADAEITKAGEQAETNRRIATAREAARKASREQHDKSTNRATNDEPNHSHSQTEIQNPPASQAPPGGKRGERLPEGWEPGEDGMAFAAGEGLANGAAAAELAKFRDYWAAQPGAKGRKADWPATWRNWVRKAAEGRPVAAKRSASDDLSELFRRGQE
jgi:uncharacterized protein YdaU (DUF1376 family)